MIRISYEQLFLEVEKLFEKKLNVKDVNGINDHCSMIISFIESTGWSVDEYTARMMCWVKPASSSSN